MSERPAESADEGSDQPYRAATSAEAPADASGDLLLELEALEARLLEVSERVRLLRGENAEWRARCHELERERDALWRERGAVSSRLAQIIAKVDALRGET
jgi:chromosome segregation ATPase